MKNGRLLGAHSPPKASQLPHAPDGKDQPQRSRIARRQDAARGWTQGYNAHAVTTADHIVIAAEVTVDPPAVR